LFTHHLSSADVVRFLKWMEQYARVGWFINDLERSERAARWFRVLPVILRWHRFVRHDGPVSLRRAFRAEDWQRLLAQAGIPSNEASIESHLMARLCVARIR
jgi:alkylated DNA nucleotide flippase Atl1